MSDKFDYTYGHSGIAEHKGSGETLSLKVYGDNASVFEVHRKLSRAFERSGLDPVIAECALLKETQPQLIIQSSLICK